MSAKKATFDLGRAEDVGIEELRFSAFEAYSDEAGEDGRYRLTWGTVPNGIYRPSDDGEDDVWAVKIDWLHPLHDPDDPSAEWGESVSYSRSKELTDAFGKAIEEAEKKGLEVRLAGKGKAWTKKRPKTQASKEAQKTK